MIKEAEGQEARRLGVCVEDVPGGGEGLEGEVEEQQQDSTTGDFVGADPNPITPELGRYLKSFGRVKYRRKHVGFPVRLDYSGWPGWSRGWAIWGSGWLGLGNAQPTETCKNNHWTP